MQQKSNHETEKTYFLVSFKTLREISNEIIKEVDVLDLKNPEKGSIGSWEENEIKKVISLYRGKVKISATLGDIFCEKEFQVKLENFDKLNLDFIKFGLLASKSIDLFNKIHVIEMKKYKTSLVCVVFVDIKNSLDSLIKNLQLIKTSGVSYVLLDTYKKGNGDLLSFCEISFLKNIIFRCKNHDIKVGLAGSLKEHQVSSVIKLKPNIIGFRSAVCLGNDRNSSIHVEKIKKISNYFKSLSSKAIQRAGA